MPATVMCAIYTRTSSDERLNSDFNSLDAQREACAHYISSRKGDGWVALTDAYSDAGFSGKNTERPALQRLLEDIKAGKVDAVVIYKLDRISRSLRDFLSLLSIFEGHGVACVSISQSFDTKSAMGRLMMNVLLSFAEFEREVIGERIRDKIAASRKRGRWTGGTAALGFDVDRTGASPKLVVNSNEASRVLAIFALYIEMGSLLSVVAELNRRGWRCKSWTTRDGRRRGGEAFDRTRLSVLLKNPIYVGKIKHKDALPDGEHEAIAPQALFDKVRRLLKSNGRGGPEHRNKHGALLRGIHLCSSVSYAPCVHANSAMTGSHNPLGFREFEEALADSAPPDSDLGRERSREGGGGGTGDGRRGTQARAGGP
ncbi:MAG: recombinase family protein [Phycisphaerae bacterium]